MVLSGSHSLILALVLLAALSGKATVIVSPASGGSAISANTAFPGGSGAWTTLGPITITESAKQDLNPGSSVTLNLKTPAGFEFNTASTPSVSFLAGKDIQSASAAYVNNSTLTVTFSVADRVDKDALTIGAIGLRVRPTQTAPLLSGRHLYRPSTGGGSAVISGVAASSDGSGGTSFGALNEVAGVFTKLRLLLPGESPAPGTASGKTGAPVDQVAGASFPLVIQATDAYWNTAATASGSIGLSSTDPRAALPVSTNLVNGTRSVPVTLRSIGTHTLSANDLSASGMLSASGVVQVLESPSEWLGGPVVAIHDSELTRALAGINAGPGTPSGPGTTGKQWWTTNWNYFVMPESLREALRSDGTIFELVSDSDIAAGHLLRPDGKPRYPIVFSLAAEAVGDDQVAPLTNYVAAGGFLFVGSSSFTRRPDGTARGNFAFAAELGVNSATTALTNWVENTQFAKQTEHRLVNHIPAGVLFWEMPGSAEEIPWGRYPHPSNPYPASPAWQVSAAGASTLASGDATPLLLEKAFGAGRFIYYSPMQPLVGYGGWSPGMYAYLIFRNSITWAFDSARLPVVRLSPWPFAYDAAMVVRHDLENYQSGIAGIESFAQFENSHGTKGDYFFVTGTLREEMFAFYDTNLVVASLHRAVSNYNATIGPHNGGLRNPYNSPPLAKPDYDYWHWGPDEALDLTPPGYSSGKDYAFLSLSNSFADIESWLGALSPANRRSWVSPYFNSVREDSLAILEGLGVKATGEKKLSFFPHWTLSTRTSGKRYPFLNIPVSDWFVGGTVSQSIEAGHTLQSLRDGIDFYYQQGALINFYGHLLNSGGLQGEYVRYTMDTNLHPRVWAANALGLHGWSSQRSAVSLWADYHLTNGNQAVVTASAAGSTNNTVAVELAFPGSSTLSDMQVFTNGSLALPPAYRLSGLRLKVLIGSTVTNVQVRYHFDPKALPDAYWLTSGPALDVPAPGVLANDVPGIGGGDLTSLLVNAPANGSLVLSTNGGFTYVPGDAFPGDDAFTYKVDDGSAQSLAAVVTISNNLPVWDDNFSRSSNPPSLAPWTLRSGSWTISNGELLNGPNTEFSYGTVYYPAAWTDYSVSARVRFDPASFGGGIAGRLNPATGARYSLWLYPAASSGGPNVLKLIKFQNWNTWSLLGQVSVPDVGTNWNTLKLGFFGPRITAFLNGIQMLSVSDTLLPLTSGGISLGNWTDSLPEVVGFDDVKVLPFVVDDYYAVPQNSALQGSAPGVLTNDTNPLGGSMVAELVRGPAGGTVTLNPNGSFIYSPKPGFAGLDRFIYRASVQGTNIGSAWANITVGGLYPAPNISAIQLLPNAAAITWTTVPGRTYRLQYADALPGGSWLNAVPDLQATGAALTGTNVVGAAQQRFYRVILLP